MDAVLGSCGFKHLCGSTVGISSDELHASMSHHMIDSRVASIVGLQHPAYIRGASQDLECRVGASQLEAGICRCACKYLCQYTHMHGHLILHARLLALSTKNLKATQPASPGFTSTLAEILTAIPNILNCMRVLEVGNGAAAGMMGG